MKAISPTLPELSDEDKTHADVRRIRNAVVADKEAESCKMFDYFDTALDDSLLTIFNIPESGKGKGKDVVQLERNVRASTPKGSEISHQNSTRLHVSSDESCRSNDVTTEQSMVVPQHAGDVSIAPSSGDNSNISAAQSMMPQREAEVSIAPSSGDDSSTFAAQSTVVPQDVADVSIAPSSDDSSTSSAQSMVPQHVADVSIAPSSGDNSSISAVQSMVVPQGEAEVSIAPSSGDDSSASTAAHSMLPQREADVSIAPSSGDDSSTSAAAESMAAQDDNNSTNAAAEVSIAASSADDDAAAALQQPAQDDTSSGVEHEEFAEIPVVASSSQAAEGAAPDHVKPCSNILLKAAKKCLRKYIKEFKEAVGRHALLIQRNDEPFQAATFHNYDLKLTAKVLNYSVKVKVVTLKY
ncbi:polysialoglycoprotein-like [Hyalella azteca]|uniref:Polysialoglycoprotein-like n=1 Tax=Hyalella azteca TaxID=294128 RepID=A0A979FWU8_HYAAZ|nr:polysialoglycoprotein-like [Hyalella azteca]